jgi:hypothetical protein
MAKEFPSVGMNEHQTTSGRLRERARSVVLLGAKVYNVHDTVARGGVNHEVLAKPQATRGAKARAKKSSLQVTQ